MAEKRSALHQTLVSIESETGILNLRNSHVVGYPCPQLSSLSAETEVWAPEAAIRW
jgi:hypothetical protein